MNPAPGTPRSPADLPRPTLGPDGLPVGSQLRPGWEVSPRQTRDLLARSDDRPLLLDCRRPEEFAVARIDGAVLIPMDAIESRLDELEDEQGSRDRPIIVHCHHGMRSMRVTAQLRAHGFANVHSMFGGIDLWSLDIDPRVPRY
ncbi:MAG: rhodanese-like domain-containing protein [Phycisphaerales bacterium]